MCWIAPSSAPSLSVCIIGAGAGGLIAAKTIREFAKRIVVLEKSDNVGGAWDYMRNGHKGAMYSTLRTNLPKEVMQFRDVPFPSHLPSFMPRQDVQKYLEEFSGDVKELIRFNAEVVRVEHNGGVGSWVVKWKEVSDDGVVEEMSEEFSAVCVCNGHFDVPYIPEEFQDLPNIVHSREYDGPRPFAGQKVCIVGTGPSAADIAYEVGLVAESMTVVGRRHEGESIASEKGTLVSRLDHTELEAFDTVILCTGYCYDFPFLDNTIRVDENLLELIMWPKDPTLAFIGLPSGVIPFPLMEIQAKVFAGYLSGRLGREKLGEFGLINSDNVFKMNVTCPTTGLPSRATYWRHLIDLLDGDDYNINLNQWRLCTEIHAHVAKDRYNKLPWDPPTYREIEYRVEETDEGLKWYIIG